MKRLLLLLVFILSMSSVLAITQSYPEENMSRSSSQIIESPIVKVSQLKYEPYPVEPGSYFTVWLRVDNIANEDADNVVVEISDLYPFKVDGERTKSIGKLASRQSSVVYFERIRVDDNALEGDNDLEVRINMGGGYQNTYSIQKLKVRVQSVEPLLSISLSSSPAKIPQGGISNVSISVQNLDTSTLEDVNVKLVLPSSFIMIGSTSEKKIQRLAPGSARDIDYEVMALADSESKPYQISLEVSYSDETGVRFSKNDTLGLLVGADPDFILNLEKSDVFAKDKSGKVTLSVSNTGPSQLKFLTVEVLQSGSYVVLSNSKSYLGNLDPDDFETAEFNIFAEDTGVLPLKVKVSYKDSYNIQKDYATDLGLKVYSSGELRKYGLGNESFGFAWIFYVLAVIFLYLSVREWRRERDVSKALKNALRIMLLAVVKFFRAFRWGNIKRLPRKIRLFLQQ